jgi:uncharacterized protein DUF4394
VGLVSKNAYLYLKPDKGLSMRTLRIELGLLAGLSFATLLAGCDDFMAFGGNGSNAPPPGMGVTSGDTFGLTSTGRLVTFDRASPSLDTAVAITGLQSGETLLGVDVRPGGMTPGQLYGLGSTGRLYTIDTTTGAATLKSTLAADPTDTSAPFTTLSGTEFGVDFNPVVDRLRIVSDTGQNLRVNVDSGATITDGNLNVGGTTRMGVTDAAYTSNYAATCRTQLFFIDPSTDKLLTTADPNAGTVMEVGSLGVDASAVGGFEISTAGDGSNTAIAVFSVSNTPAVYAINLTTGVATPAGQVTGLQSGEALRGAAGAPPTTAPANAPGQIVAVTESNKLISFQSGTPQKLCTSTAVTGLQGGDAIIGIDTRPADGALYAVGSTGRIYTVNTSTGAATMKSMLAADPADTTAPFTGLTGTEYGVDFNPVPDRLRIVSDTGQNLRINVDTGATTTDGDLNPAGPIAVAAAYTNSFAGAGATSLYVLDAAGDSLQLQNPPNDGVLSPVGALGLGDIQSVAGFDINGLNNAAIAAVNLAGVTTSELDSVSLATGAATKVNTIGGGERVRGVAFVATPVATVFGATTDNRLVSFKVTTPGTFDTSTPITGLQGGEMLIGMDFRPANGKLYVATNGGRVYTLDPATGAATIAANFMADAADMTAPFTALSGNNFGVDFNPLADRLRIVSDNGQSLRINVDNGATTTDTNLNPGTPQVVAVAYGSSFPMPPATKLYDIDVAANSLQLQNPPNDGVLSPIGALDPVATFGTTAGFNIVGGDDGLSLAALQAAGTAQSTLYRVNLKTGATTSVGALGPAGSPLVKALAIRLK